MPVNMDPAKKRRSTQAQSAQPSVHEGRTFGEETTVDKEKDLADAEWKNLWDATEVIDMDKV